ncbi:DNA polymerase III subunit alpha [Bacillus sp. cl95]|uniref:DNA polymerase III subunit alpha n=1 Tax=Bacillus sp. cl95 TaxID=1761761 RepID=UPI000B838B9E|nr:DNA polymerase III subunit alpha [Bacillus sp. cl95]
MSFIHLHVYSAFSLLTSTAKVEDLVSNAKSKGFNAIALTDRNVMHGTVAFYKECLKQQIKPILGLTVDVESEINPTSSFPLILLAENNSGFENLLKISSVVQTKAENGIPLKWLKHYSAGLVAISPGKEGEIENYLLEGNLSAAEETLTKFKSIFSESNLFFAIQDQRLTGEQELNQLVKTFTDRFGIPLVGTNSVYYLEKEDSFAQECLLAIKNGEKLQDEHRETLPSNQYYLKTVDEMTECLSDFPEALENTITITERCNVLLELNRQLLPKYPVQAGESSEELLERLCHEGLEKRYTQVQELHLSRLKYELSVIKKMKFSDYFLIVWDFMSFARSKGILTGPGRGSAAGSLVAYALQITDVDPIEHELLFERFLNPERISMPDIDIDFPDHRRDEVIEYVAAKYGELHVAQIVTFGTMATKAALRDVGRAFGLNPKELDMLSRLVPSRLGISLEAAYNESQALRTFVNENNLNARLFETALKLEGLPRHISTHAAGVVISEKPLVELVPIQKGHNGIYLTQYSMEYLEEIGLLKMDFLGLRNLTLIGSILDSIRKKKGEKLDIRSIPLNDEKTFELLARGETSGIFQLESEGMKKVLTRLKPTSFEDIVAVNALYRPGPMENIPSFIDRKHGKEEIVYPHPDLKPILEKTYGVIVYQEQIMQIAYKMAGFSLGEADLLRRAVGKKKKEVLDKERQHFIKGSLQQGYTEKLADEIYDLIVKFANYGFNRSHAVAYSVISYQLAYLKAHYFSYFMAELLSASIGNDIRITQYIRELKQNGISVLAPSINKSSYRFQVETNSIRYSLSAIKGVGSTVIKEILQARKQKKFDDLFDFCIRVSMKIVNRKILETLVHSGCFDEFGEDRAVLLASLDVAIEHAQLVKPDDDNQFDLFADDEFSLKPKYVEVDTIRIEDKLYHEKLALGLYLSDHPLSAYEQELKKKGASSLFELDQQKKWCSTGVYITEVKKIRTKKGEAMAFLTVSDSTDEMEAIAFPTVFKKSSTLMNQGEIVVLEGKVEERDGKWQLLIQNVIEMDEWLKSKSVLEKVLYLKIEEKRNTPDGLKALKEMLKDDKGDTDVVLFYESSKKSVRLTKEFGVSPTPSLLIKLRDFLGTNNVILRE